MPKYEVLARVTVLKLIDVQAQDEETAENEAHNYLNNLAWCISQVDIISVRKPGS